MTRTRQMCMWMFVILSSKITYVQSSQSFQMKVENLNKQLLGYNLFIVTDSSLHTCVTECMFIGACASVNFMTRTLTCELNSAGSKTADPAEIVKATGTIFSDISEWPKSMAKGCANHECEHLERCLPLYNEGYKCIDIVCEDPPSSQYGVIQPGSTITGTVRQYAFTCPDDMFVSGDTSITCQDNGKWTPLEATCIDTTLGTECISEDDCKETGAVCNQGYCFCNRLYRYDTDSRDCVKVCSTMTDTFTVTNGMRVLSFNDIGITTGTLVADCLTLCMNDKNCTSFEYNKDSDGCRRSTLSQQMVEDALPNAVKFDNENVDFYTRDCL